KLAAERRRRGRIRVRPTRPGLAAGALRRLSRLSADPGTRLRVRRPRDHRQPDGGSQLYADRSPRAAELNVAAITESTSRARRNPVLREIGSWSLSLKFGTAIVSIIVLAAIFAPWIAPYDPDAQDFDALLMPPGWTHLFGTDSLGRDIFSRVL